MQIHAREINSPLHYSPLHYSPLHYSPLHYSPLHYSPVIFAEIRARRSADSSEHFIIFHSSAAMIRAEVNRAFNRPLR